MIENENENDNSIVITDEAIVSFYKTNPNLCIVTMNHIFIDILKNLSSNLSNNIQSTIQSRILSIVSDIQQNMNHVKNDILLKLYDCKKEYIDDVKTLMDNNSLSTHEKISSLVEKTNDNLFTKTSLILNELIPKSQDKTYFQIENCIKSVCMTISQDTAKLLEMNNDEDVKIKMVIENMENQLNKLMNNIQNPIFSFIQMSEERTNHGIQQVKDLLSTQKIHQEKLTGELNIFLNKYKNNSSSKGNVSETELYYLLQKLMPCDEILKVGNDTATCDFKVNRVDNNKPTILFENKDYMRSVTTDEVKKFERDVQLQKNHGIFISQNSPITYKNNFQIDILNGLIHVYIPNAEYDSNKIKIAIDIVDNLSMKLDSLSRTQVHDFSIQKEDVDEILEEYKHFVNQKVQIMDIIKQNNKLLLDKMEEIQFPKLKKIFIKTGNIENDNEFKCSFCNDWCGKNKASLAAHTRNCKLNPKNKDTVVVGEVIQISTSMDSPPIVIDTNITVGETIEENKVENKIEKKEKKRKIIKKNNKVN